MSELTFKPRARLMLLLGDQLIRNAGIAVFELVKNAYDADATKCTISLFNVHENRSDAKVVVEDNGSGMDLATIKEVWLSPGTRHRLSQREAMLGRQTETSRSKHGRLPLGEKGVGRFAVHKLGNRVELVTRAPGEQEVVVTIDWTRFDNDDPLSTIPVKVVKRDPECFTGRRTGTRICVADLRDLPWTRRRVRYLHRAITSICSPVGGPEGFVAALNLDPVPSGWLDGLLTAEEVLDLALFRFSGQIENGVLTYNYEFKPWLGMKAVERRIAESKRVDVPVKRNHGKRPGGTADGADNGDEDADTRKYRIGAIDLDFRVFDRGPEVLQFVSGNAKQLKDYLDENGGVRVYRNGVRVYDFGERDNDWLGLGALRVNVPVRRIGNNQLIGIVRLRLAESQDLIEKTNREGFVENSAYRAFHDAVRFAITQAEAERNVDKERI